MTSLCQCIAIRTHTPLIRCFSHSPLLSRLLEVQRRPGAPTPLPPLSSLHFGHHFTDHMLEVDWRMDEGWRPPIIKQFGTISLHPASSCIHYGLQAFEGLKAFAAPSGRILMFRPEMNMTRLRRSCERLALPIFEEKELLECIRRLVLVDRSHMPKEPGYSLYIRPVVISTQPTLGVSAPREAKLLVMLSPVGPYFASGFKPVSLFASTRHVRAFKGGVGDFKVGGNYGPTILPQREAQQEGYAQVLWLLPTENDYLATECGTMNLMAIWRDPVDGKLELVTPPLDDQIILPGVTRDSVLHLAKNIDDIRVVERPILMRGDLLRAMAEGRLCEVFGTGTAAVIAPIDAIGFAGTRFTLPMGENDEGKEAGIGPIGRKLLKELHEIQYGLHPGHPWNTPVE